MENRTLTELIIELADAQNLYFEIITLRKRKMIVRWILGALFYYCFWGYTWVEYLFWIGLFSEMILLIFTLGVYFRLKSKIQLLEKQISELN